MPNDLVNNLRIASPCPVGWDSMSGDNTVRYCHLCQLNVYNFSEMTTAEVEQLVTRDAFIFESLVY